MLRRWFASHPFECNIQNGSFPQGYAGPMGGRGTDGPKVQTPASTISRGSVCQLFLGLSPQTGTGPADLCVLLLSQGSRGQDGLPGSDGEPGEDVSAFAFKSGPRWPRW